MKMLVALTIAKFEQGRRAPAEPGEIPGKVLDAPASERCGRSAVSSSSGPCEDSSAAYFVEPVPGPNDVPWKYKVGRTRERMIAEDLDKI